jgi:transposase-like protein
MTCVRCQHSECKRFGFFGKRRVQRWRCNSCNSTFCEPHARLTRAAMLSQPKAAEQAIRCLLEGCSIRSTERLTGLNRNTIMRLLLIAGERSVALMDARMTNLRPRYLQIDEIWTFVAKKARNVRKDDSPEMGDQWVFVAMDAENKLVPSYFVGRRTSINTKTFMHDLYKRTASHVQITTDGYLHLPDCCAGCFWSGRGLRAACEAVR